jgi:hypothetical protein
MLRALWAGRSAEFRRRSALYGRLDSQLCDHTRFFAAAALVNCAFARLFGTLHRMGAPPCSFAFLNEAGALLERDNVDYARAIGRRTPGKALDRALVYAEQRQLQHFVRVYQTQRPRQWEFVRHQLNGLLNDRYVASLSRWCHASQRLVRVLRQVRGEAGPDLDFALESHRIRIGLALIENIRKDTSGVANIF